MSLVESIKECLGVDFGDLDGQGGGVLAERYFRVLADQNLAFEEQRSNLLRATYRIHDLDFVRACLDRIDQIDAVVKRRAAVEDKPVRKCRSGVAKNKDWPPRALYADLRFEAARTKSPELLDAIDDMLKRLAAEGYFESYDGVVRDLRQGLGYYRPGEDVLRRRRTVRWLRRNNTLHVWIYAMVGGRHPLIRPQSRANGCWKTAASMFVDEKGCAYTYGRLEHGILKNAEQERWLHALVPKPPTDNS